MNKTTSVPQLANWVLASIISLSAASELLASSPYEAAVQADAPSAYFRFSDSLPRSNVNTNSAVGQGVSDLTNTFNLRAFPGALAGDGNRSQFFHTGNSFGMVPFSPGLNPDNTKPFTMEAWFYPASDQINGGQCTINNRLAGSAANRSGWVIFQRAPDASYTGKSGFEGIGWNFRMYRGSGGSTGLDVATGVPYQVGAWTHFVAVYDPIDPVTNANLILYVNGVPVITNTWTGGVSGTDPGYVANAAGSDVAMSLGAYNNTSGAGQNPYFGAIDEVAFYPSKLTDAQILAHYQNGTNAHRATPYNTLVQSENPALYLRLDELPTGPDQALNLGDVRNAGIATHTAQVRHPASSALAGRSDDGSAAYHNRGGNSSTTMPYLPQNNPDSSVPFTFETWLRPLRDQQGGQCPVNNRWVGGTGRTGWVIFQRNPNLSYPASEGHGWNFRMYSGSGSGGQDVLTDTDYVIGEWQHLVVTWEPQTDNGDPAANGNHQFQGILTAWVNGAAVASNTAALYAANVSTTETGAAAADLAIGSYNAASGLGNNPYEGQVDELAIYTNYVLTAAQILAHYMSGTNSHPATNYETLVLTAAYDGQPSTPQRTGPPTYLRFNDPAMFPARNSGTLGSAADGNLILTTNNAAGPRSATYSGFEAANPALPLDGTRQWASFNDPAGLNISGKITLEAWVQPAAVQGSVARIISHGPATLSSFDTTTVTNAGGALVATNEVFLRLDGNGAEYVVGSSNGFDFHGVSAPVPAGDLGTSNWVYLVGAYDGSNWRLYRNGVQLASAADSIGALPVTDADWAIGATGNGWADSFAGTIDEVAIYPTALTPAQIQSHYAAAQGTVTGPIVLTIVRSGTSATIQYSSGTLQQSDSVTGTYTDVQNATSPYTVPPATTLKFYRARQ